MINLSSIFLVGLLLIPSPAISQSWKWIGTIDPYPTCGYFWDSAHGVVACASVESDLHLGNPILTVFKTENGGVTWSKCYTPVGMGFRPTAIAMKSRLLGYMTLAGPYAEHCDAKAVLSTSDGGYTWTQVDSIMQWNNVAYVDGSPVFSNGGISPISSDYVVVTTASEPGCNWKFRNGEVFRTTDRGVSWLRVSNVGESFGSAYEDRSRSLIVYPEIIYSHTANDHVFVSQDSGRTWGARSPIFKDAQACGWTYPGGITGDVRSDAGVIFVQSCGGSGLYRSTDVGITWKRIGGPSNDMDTRFCVVPSCRGGTVIAFSRDGGVWLTTDGGDGTLEETLLALTLDPPRSISACTTAVSSLKLQSNYCENSLTVDSIWFDDPSHFEREISEALPITLGGAATTMLHYRFTPNGAAGDYVTKLHVRGRMLTATDTLVLDTVFTVLAAARATGPTILAVPSSASLGTLSLCSNGLDTTLAFINSGCDNDTVSSIASSNGDYSIPPYSYPIILRPGDTLRVPVHLTPHTPGRTQGAITVRSSSQGIVSTQDALLEAIVTSASSALAFGLPSGDSSRTICDPDTVLSGDFVNTGCDSVHITDLSITGNGYALLTGPRDTVLAPGERLRYTVRFTSSTRGQSDGEVSVHATGLSSHASLDTTGTITFFVSGGTRFITESTSLSDFGPLNICEDSSSTVTLTNTGCDTLTITAAEINGQGFAYDDSLPIVLQPGESTSVRVRSVADTTGHPAVVAGTLQFSSTAQNILPPVALTRRFIYPAHLDLKLTGSENGEAGSVAIFSVMLEGVVPQDMQSLTFSVDADEDILGFVSATGVTPLGSTNASGSHRSREYRLSPVHTGEIAVLKYRTHVAKSAETPITIAGVSFDHLSKVADDCIASIGDSSARYTFVYRCGEGIIQQYLQTGQVFELLSAEPNPAANELWVGVWMAESGEPIRLTIHDLLGHERLARDVTSPTTALDVSSLPAGTYFLRLSSGGQASSPVEVRTRRFVIER